MSTVSISGNDTSIIDKRVLNDLADGDAITISFEGEIASLKTGKNGNSIYSLNETGKQAIVKIRVLRGSEDDKILNNRLIQQQANFAGHILISGQFIKKIGDGKGNITSDTYIMSGGIFTKQVDAKSNVEGDTEQSVSIYTIKFSNAPRAIT